MDNHHQIQIQQESLEHPDQYWGKFAADLHWDKPFSAVLTKPAGPGQQHVWFKDGMLNTCYNAVDRHVLNGRGKQVAIYYDSPLNNEKRQITYQELLEQVQTAAGVIASHGVKKGDMVLIYSKSISDGQVCAIFVVGHWTLSHLLCSPQLSLRNCRFQSAVENDGR